MSALANIFKPGPQYAAQRSAAYLTFDKWLNRSILGALLVAIVIAFFVAIDDPPRRSTPQITMDTSSLISILNSPCPLIDQRLTYFESCRRIVGGDTGRELIVCPAAPPQGVTYKPTSMSMVTSVISSLKSQKQSGRCAFMNMDVELGDLDGLSWSENQQQILDQLDSTIESIGKANEQRRAMSEGEENPLIIGPKTKDQTDEPN